MKSADIKYAFPLFTHKESTAYMFKNKDQVIVSDIWAFWTFIIKQWSKHKYKDTKIFLLSLLDQAKYFYQAAQVAPLNSQPLLYYYSFLNLAKIIISISGQVGEKPSKRQFCHGISTDPSGVKFSKYQVTIKSLLPTGDTSSNPENNKISVGYQLMKYFGDSLLNPPIKINIQEALANCVGIHRAYCLAQEKPEKFTRIVNCELMCDKKKLIARLYTNVSNKELEKIYHLQPSNKQDTHKGKYFWQEDVTMRNYVPTKTDYYNLSQLLLQKGIKTYANGEDYIMYISSNDRFKFSSASLIYCLMFFFGSLTRYHPHIFELYLSEEYKWLIAEFLKTQPTQFLYIATSQAAEAFITKPSGCGLLE